VAGRKNCRQDVRASKCRQWRAIENGKEEETECSQVAEYRGHAVPPTRSGIPEKDVQHEPTISTSLDTFWEQPFLLSQICPMILGAIASRRELRNS
jgi:hypothetical protein